MNQKDKVQWRRNKVQELLVKGYNHYEIASSLQILIVYLDPSRELESLEIFANNIIKKR